MNIQFIILDNMNIDMVLVCSNTGFLVLTASAHRHVEYIFSMGLCTVLVYFVARVYLC